MFGLPAASLVLDHALHLLRHLRHTRIKWSRFRD